MIRELRNLPAPAKLNLFLHVVGRRADGYHLLESGFVLVDLQDRIDLRVRDDGEVRMLGQTPGVPPEQDLCVRAARLLAAESGARPGVEIDLHKRIPMGGGLGGGSSDAATVLLGLNRLWQLGWSRRALAALAARLGADVPFFVFGHDAFVRGIGEHLEALPPPLTTNGHYVIVAPAVGVATASVFGAPELTRNTKPLKITGFSQGQNPAERSEVSAVAARGQRFTAAERRVLAQACRLGRNDLQAVVETRVSEVAQALAALRRAVGQTGGSLGPVRMSGSGSCVFAAFREPAQAREAAERVRSKTDRRTRVWCVAGLVEHPLRSLATDEVW